MVQYATYAVPRMDVGQAFMEYMAALGDQFIGTKVLPLINTQVKAGTFPKITRESLLRLSAMKRQANSSYARDDYSAEDSSFSCEEYGIEESVGDDTLARYANDFDAAATASQLTARRVLAAQEQRVASAVFNTSTWTGSSLYTDISTTWATIATSTPVADIRSAQEAVMTLTGIKPDTLIINEINLGYLLNATEIKGRVQYAAIADRPTIMNALGNILDIRKILVGSGVYNSAKEGQTASNSQIWSSSYAMVCKTPDTSSLAEPCIGRTFLWTGDSPTGYVTESYREEQTRSTIYRTRQSTDEVIIDASYGHLLKVD